MRVAARDEPVPAVMDAVSSPPLLVTELPSPTSTLYGTIHDPQAPTVVLVDPMSTGVILQQRVFALGYRVVVVFSDRTQLASRERHFERSGRNREDFAAVIVHESDEMLEDTVSQILAVTTNIVAVMCGSEHGVLLEDAIADALRNALGVFHIKSSGLVDRQTKVDKHAQANIIRKAGLAAVREKLAYNAEDVAHFLEEVGGSHKSFVVKPQTGAGSVGVTFCDSEQSVFDAFHNILAGEHKVHCKSKYKHYSHAGVLLQEYLKGTEYIVNSVVRNGDIKTTAMFRYDKRPCNGAAFVCFSKELVIPGDKTEPQLDEIAEYAKRVLRAVGFRNGAIHAEIMYTEDRGPVLVELNCRLHGGNGAWVQPANQCIGYDQLSVFMDAYLNEGKHLWSVIPELPQKALAWCQQVKMRSFVEGTLQCVIPEQWARIQALASYTDHTFGVLPGDRILKTIDMPSVPGEVTLVHQDKQVLTHDYELLNEIFREGIFRVVESS